MHAHLLRIFCHRDIHHYFDRYYFCSRDNWLSANIESRTYMHSLLEKSPSATRHVTPNPPKIRAVYIRAFYLGNTVKTIRVTHSTLGFDFGLPIRSYTHAFFSVSLPPSVSG